MPKVDVFYLKLPTWQGRSPYFLIFWLNYNWSPHPLFCVFLISCYNQIEWSAISILLWIELCLKAVSNQSARDLHSSVSAWLQHFLSLLTLQLAQFEYSQWLLRLQVWRSPGCGKIKWSFSFGQVCFLFSIVKNRVTLSSPPPFLHTDSKETIKVLYTDPEPLLQETSLLILKCPINVCVLCNC